MKLTKGNLILLGLLLYNEKHINQMLTNIENKNFKSFLLKRLKEIKQSQKIMRKQLKINKKIWEIIKPLLLSYAYLLQTK